MTSKSAARAEARDRRAAVDMEAASAQVVARLRSWGGWDEQAAVLFYLALDDEVDVSPLAGDRAFVTRLGDDGRLTIHPMDSPRERHPFGFEQPVAGSAEIDPLSIDIALVPGLAFDRTGTRLGRGGGHYDRLLPRLRPGSVLVGVTPEAAVLEHLPREAHDVAMTHLATEKGVIALGRFADMEELKKAAVAWIDGDPDPATRAELQAIVDRGDGEELDARMGTPLRFGTAGIRGPMGAGSARMNRAVVIRTTAGLAEYLRRQGRGKGTVVVGFDGRTSSEAFAADTVGVLAAAGNPVRFFAETVPTPLVAFAALHLGATAAVVVTASHNPAADNGYKVYDSNGAQIIPPVDGLIAEAIDSAGPANKVPRLEAAWAGEVAGSGPITGMSEDYLREVMAFRGDDPGVRSPHIVYTPLHGVGGPLALAGLRTAGHEHIDVVAEQFQPDGTFPTVSFPNPEEPGALDMAEGLGERLGADLVLANDPDADRLAVSVPTGDGWRRLSGNEIGVLLADFVLERTGGGTGDVVINSVVSSPMLESVAAARGARFEQTLTGFKWIANAALDLEAEGQRFLFGYEEALGFTVGPVVRDKDGISAAMWFADLAAVESARGRTVLDRLADLWDEHGLWMSAQHSVRRPGSEGPMEIATAMGRLRTDPPTTVAGWEVIRRTDFAQGGESRPRWLPAANLVVLHLEGGSRVLARPSGTEPKLKFYADVRGDGDGDERSVAAMAAALARGLAAAIGLS